MKNICPQGTNRPRRSSEAFSSLENKHTSQPLRALPAAAASVRLETPSGLGPRVSRIGVEEVDLG